MDDGYGWIVLYICVCIGILILSAMELCFIVIPPLVYNWCWHNLLLSFSGAWILFILSYVRHEI